MSDITKREVLAIVFSALVISFVAFVMAEKERFNLTGFVSLFSKGNELFSISSPINAALIFFIILSMGIVMFLNAYMVKHRNK